MYDHVKHCIPAILSGYAQISLLHTSSRISECQHQTHIINIIWVYQDTTVTYEQFYLCMFISDSCILSVFSGCAKFCLSHTTCSSLFCVCLHQTATYHHYCLCVAKSTYYILAVSSVYVHIRQLPTIFLS